MKKIVVTIIFGCFASQLWSQATNLLHNGSIPSSYLGYVEIKNYELNQTLHRISSFTRYLHKEMSFL